MYKSNRKQHNAFTLLEIMLVVMIIAILAAAAIQLLAPGSITAAQTVTTRTALQNARTGLLQYQIHSGKMPTTEQGLDALVKRPEREPLPRNWHQQSERVITDGFQNPLNYKNPGVRNPSSYDVYSSGKDGIADTADDIWE